MENVRAVKAKFDRGLVSRCLRWLASLCITHNQTHTQGHTVDFAVFNDNYVCADLLRLFLAEMREPLLTDTFYERFVEAQKLADIRSRTTAMRTLYSCRPERAPALVSAFQTYSPPRGRSESGAPRVSRPLLPRATLADQQCR